MKIITKANYDFKVNLPPPNKQPSMTIPDQTMSLRTLLDRYAKNQPINGNPSQRIYDGEEIMPDIMRMDLADREDYLNSIKAEVSEIQAKLLTDKQKREQEAKNKEIEAMKAAIRAEVEAELAGKEVKSTN